MNRESQLVLGAMVAVVLVLIGVKYAYEDIMAYMDKPNAEEAKQGEQAIGDMQQLAEAHDPMDLIASVAPCTPGRQLREACVTVTPGWGQASNRQQIAADLWKGWAEICTHRGLAEQPADCRIELRSPSGETIGGSGDDDGSRIWVKE